MSNDFSWETDVSNKKEHSFVGVSEKEITEFCKNSGYPLRITMRDGKYFIITRDYKYNRFNIYVENKKVTKVWIG